MGQRGAEHGAAAVDAGADGAELGVEDLGDLVVGQTLDIAEHHGGPELRRQGPEGLLDVVVERLVGVRRVGRGQLAVEPLRPVVGQRVEPDALLATGVVEEEVGGDPVDPALEGARLVGVEAAEDPDEDLLREVLGVVAVAGQAQRETVDPVGVPVDDLLPGGNALEGSREVRRLPRVRRRRLAARQRTRRTPRPYSRAPPAGAYAPGVTRTAPYLRPNSSRRA